MTGADSLGSSSLAERATFVDRTACIGCRSRDLVELSSGGFSEEPLRGILAGEEWGESPVPFVEHERWSYVRCNACAQTFHRRVLAPEWTERLYAKWESQAAMERFLAKLETPERGLRRGSSTVAHALRLERATRSLRGGAKLRVLDFGCGWGEFVVQCRAFGFDAVGVDFAVDRRVNSRIEIHPSLDALAASGARDSGFHAVTLFQVLEHLVEPREVLERLAPLLPIGGVLVLETPDCTGVTGIRSRADYLAIGPLGHINAFTPASLRAIAAEAGFEPIRPPAAWVTASWLRAIKATGRAVLQPLLRPTTNQYFARRR